MGLQMAMVMLMVMLMATATADLASREFCHIESLNLGIVPVVSSLLPLPQYQCYLLGMRPFNCHCAWQLLLSFRENT